MNTQTIFRSDAHRWIEAGNSSQGIARRPKAAVQDTSTTARGLTASRDGSLRLPGHNSENIGM